MAERYQHTLITNFSGGVQRSVSRLLMAEDESSIIENGELPKIGSIFKVKGSSFKGADVNTDYDILGAIGGYKPSTGTLKLIAVADGASNSDAYTFNPITNVWTPHNLSLTTGAKAEFAQFLDGFFMVNFSDTTRWNNFTQWYTTTNVTTAPKARYIAIFLSRVYLFYVNYDGSTYSSRCVYSDLPTGSPMTVAWDNSLNYFDIDTDDGDVGMGLGVNGNRLLLFKEKSLFRYDTNSLYKVPGCPGTVSQRTVKNIQGLTLYLHSTGLWGYDGASGQLLSRNIDEVIKGVSASSLAGACAVVKGDHYYVFVGDVSNSQANLEISNCLIDYDAAKNACTWRSLHRAPTIFFDYKTDTSSITYDAATVSYSSAEITYNALLDAQDKTYFGTKEGQVLEWGGSNYDGQYPISFLVETRDLYFSYPVLFKLFQKVIVLHNRGAGLTIQYKVDDGNWLTLGRVDQNNSELIFPYGTRGRRIKFRLFESSSTDTFELEGLDVHYTLEGTTE